MGSNQNWGNFHHGRRAAIFLMFVAFTAVMCEGCASNTLPDDELFEREIRQHNARLNWELCEQIYIAQGVPTYHQDHQHVKHRKVHIHNVYQDLNQNRCRQVLQEYWIQ